MSVCLPAVMKIASLRLALARCCSLGVPSRRPRYLLEGGTLHPCKSLWFAMPRRSLFALAGKKHREKEKMPITAHSFNFIIKSYCLKRSGISCLSKLYPLMFFFSDSITLLAIFEFAPILKTITAFGLFA